MGNLKGNILLKKLYLLLFCFVTACSLARPDVSILESPQCELPCWNGIIPGETSYPDALEIVTGLDGLDPEKTNILNAPWQIFNKRIWFYLYTDSSLAKVQTDGAVYFIDDKVAALFLQRNIGKTFGEMVEMVGEPETIISMPFVTGSTVVMAVIPSKGVMFEFYAKSDELQPETEIDNIMVFDITHYEDLLNTAMFSLGHYDANETREIMYPWKGYGNIEVLYTPRFPE
jgi:hypothetical protein